MSTVPVFSVVCDLFSRIQTCTGSAAYIKRKGSPILSTSVGAYTGNSHQPGSRLPLLLPGPRLPFNLQSITSQTWFLVFPLGHWATSFFHRLWSLATLFASLQVTPTASRSSLKVARQVFLVFIFQTHVPSPWRLSCGRHSMCPARFNFLTLTIPDFVSEMTYYVSSGTLNSTNST